MLLRFARTALAGILLLASAVRGQAQEPPQRQADSAAFGGAREEVSAPERKTPSIFRRPSCSTPSAQLLLAEKLERKGRLRSARRAYDALVHHWHASPEAPSAQLGVARIRERTGHHLRAFREYQYAIAHFAGLFPHENVVERQFQIANLLRGERDRGWFGIGREAGADEVIALFRQVARNATSGPRTAECYLMMGLTYEARKRYEEAITPYETLTARFPDHELADTALFRSAHCRFRLAKRNPRDEQTLRHALSALTAFRRDAPGHPESARIEAWQSDLRSRLVRLRFGQAAFYDRIRDNPGAAAVAYGEFIRMFASWPEAQTEIEAAKARLAAFHAHQPGTDEASFRPPSPLENTP